MVRTLIAPGATTARRCAMGQRARASYGFLHADTCCSPSGPWGTGAGADKELLKGAAL